MKKHHCKITFIIGLILIGLTGLAIFFEVTGPISIIDTNEHLNSMAQAEKLLEANDSNRVSKTLLIPSPQETLTLNGHKSFTGYRENMDVIFDIAKKYPNRFIPFCSLNPLDPDPLDDLKNCLEKGGKGLMLYNGNPYYHEIFGMPLDSPRMAPIYAFAEKNKLPILFHVNVSLYENELKKVLEKFPKLTVSIPSYMLSNANTNKVTALLDAYPNLYTDIGFGSAEFMASGFRRMNMSPDNYLDFIEKHSTQILFGADMVLADTQEKDASLVKSTIACYRNFLEEATFSCPPVSDYYKATLEFYKNQLSECQNKKGNCKPLQERINIYQDYFDSTAELKGMNLSKSILRQIYEKNPRNFLMANQ